MIESTWMELAKVLARKKSKDPKTKVGCFIVDKDNRPVSCGYNGMVKGCNESQMWDNKHPFVIHAEMNAALFARRWLGGCDVYVTHSPCLNCMKHLFQLGGRTIYYDVLYTYTEEEIEQILIFTNSLMCYVLNINTDRTITTELKERLDEIRKTRKELLSSPNKV